MIKKSDQNTQKHRLGLRATALAMVFVFTMTSATWNSPAIAAPAVTPPSVFEPIEKLTVPAGLGTITAQHGGGSQELREKNNLSTPNSALRTVILIQDAHAVVDAQQSIQKLIEYFDATYGIRLVAMEGAREKLDPTLFRAFPGMTGKKKVLAGYLNRGELTGTEMDSIFGEKDREHYGIETWPLYEDNYRAYLHAVANKPELLKQCGIFREKLDTARKGTYSAPLNEFHEQYDHFRMERANFVDFLVYLLNFKKLLAPRPDLAEFNKLLDSVGYTASRRQEKLDTMIKSMAAEFKTKFVRGMGVKDEMNFYSRYQAFLTGKMDSGKFLQYMIEAGKAKGFRPKLTPQMKLLLGHTETLSAIKGSKIYTELQTAVAIVESDLIKKPEEKTMAEKYRRLALLNDLIALEWTHEELEQYQKSPEDCLDLLGDPDFRKALTPALEFYQCALDRDKAFYKNLTALMDRKKQKSAIVVAGGFHTNGLKRILEENKIAYAVVMPKMDSLAGRENYDKVMQNDVSYKEYLKTTYYDAFVRAATQRLVAELNEPDFRRDLKSWRDEVIRELSRQGRITEAGQYTNYLDKLIALYVEKFGRGTSKSKEEILKAIEKELNDFRDKSFAAIWQKFESQLQEFMGGVKDLANKNELTAHNVLRLFDSVSNARPSALAAALRLGRTAEIIEPVVLSEPGVEAMRNVNLTLSQIHDALPTAMPKSSGIAAVRAAARLLQKQAIPLARIKEVTPNAVIGETQLNQAVGLLAKNSGISRAEARTQLAAEFEKLNPEDAGKIPATEMTKEKETPAIPANAPARAETRQPSDGLPDDQIRAESTGHQTGEWITWEEYRAWHMKDNKYMFFSEDVPAHFLNAVQEMITYAVENGYERNEEIGTMSGFYHVHVLVPSELSWSEDPAAVSELIFKKAVGLMGHTQEAKMFDPQKRNVLMFLGGKPQGLKPSQSSTALQAQGLSQMLGMNITDAGTLYFHKSSNGAFNYFIIIKKKHQGFKAIQGNQKLESPFSDMTSGVMNLHEQIPASAQEPMTLVDRLFQRLSKDFSQKTASGAKEFQIEVSGEQWLFKRGVDDKEVELVIGGTGQVHKLPSLPAEKIGEISYPVQLVKSPEILSLLENIGHTSRGDSPSRSEGRLPVKVSMEGTRQSSAAETRLPETQPARSEARQDTVSHTRGVKMVETAALSETLSTNSGQTRRSEARAQLVAEFEKLNSEDTGKSPAAEIKTKALAPEIPVNAASATKRGETRIQTIAGRPQPKAIAEVSSLQSPVSAEGRARSEARIEISEAEWAVAKAKWDEFMGNFHLYHGTSARLKGSILGKDGQSGEGLDVKKKPFSEEKSFRFFQILKIFENATAPYKNPRHIESISLTADLRLAKDFASKPPEVIDIMLRESPGLLERVRIKKESMDEDLRGMHNKLEGGSTDPRLPGDIHNLEKDIAALVEDIAFIEQIQVKYGSWESEHKPLLLEVNNDRSRGILWSLDDSARPFRSFEGFMGFAEVLKKPGQSWDDFFTTTMIDAVNKAFRDVEVSYVIPAETLKEIPMTAPTIPNVKKTGSADFTARAETRETQPAVRSESRATDVAANRRRIVELYKSGTNNLKNAIGVHGTSIEAILYLIKNGRLPNEGRTPGEFYFYPLEDGFDAMEEVQAYTDANAPFHYVLAKLKTQFTNDELELLFNYMNFPGSAKEYVSLFKKVDKKELDSIIREAKRKSPKGVVLLISRQAIEAAKIKIEMGGDKTANERFIRLKSGLPLDFIIGIKPLGVYEREALEEIAQAVSSIDNTTAAQSRKSPEIPSTGSTSSPRAGPGQAQPAIPAETPAGKRSELPATKNWEEQLQGKLDGIRALKEIPPEKQAEKLSEAWMDLLNFMAENKVPEPEQRKAQGAVKKLFPLFLPDYETSDDIAHLMERMKERFSSRSPRNDNVSQNGSTRSEARENGTKIQLRTEMHPVTRMNIERLLANVSGPLLEHEIDSINQFDRWLQDDTWLFGLASHLAAALGLAADVGGVKEILNDPYGTNADELLDVMEDARDIYNDHGFLWTKAESLFREWNQSKKERQRQDGQMTFARSGIPSRPRPFTTAQKEFLRGLFVQAYARVLTSRSEARGKEKEVERSSKGKELIDRLVKIKKSLKDAAHLITPEKDSDPFPKGMLNKMSDALQLRFFKLDNEKELLEINSTLETIGERILTLIATFYRVGDDPGVAIKKSARTTFVAGLEDISRQISTARDQIADAVSRARALAFLNQNRSEVRDHSWTSRYGNAVRWMTLVGFLSLPVAGEAASVQKSSLKLTKAQIIELQKKLFPKQPQYWTGNLGPKTRAALAAQKQKMAQQAASKKSATVVPASPVKTPASQPKASQKIPLDIVVMKGTNPNIPEPEPLKIEIMRYSNPIVSGIHADTQLPVINLQAITSAIPASEKNASRYAQRIRESTEGFNKYGARLNAGMNKQDRSNLIAYMASAEEINEMNANMTAYLFGKAEAEGGAQVNGPALPGGFEPNSLVTLMKHAMANPLEKSVLLPEGIKDADKKAILDLYEMCRTESPDLKPAFTEMFKNVDFRQKVEYLYDYQRRVLKFHLPVPSRSNPKQMMKTYWVVFGPGQIIPERAEAKFMLGGTIVNEPYRFLEQYRLTKTLEVQVYGRLQGDRNLVRFKSKTPDWKYAMQQAEGAYGNAKLREVDFIAGKYANVPYAKEMIAAAAAAAEWEIKELKAGRVPKNTPPTADEVRALAPIQPGFIASTARSEARTSAQFLGLEKYEALYPYMSKKMDEMRIIKNAWRYGFSPSGDRLAIRDSKDHLVLRYVSENTEISLKNADDITEFRFSPSGDQIAVRYKDNSIRLYDAKSGREILYVPWLVSEFHFQGRLFAVKNNADGLFQLFDVKQGNSISLPITNGVSGFSFSNSGDRLLIGDFDGVVHLYDLDLLEEGFGREMFVGPLSHTHSVHFLRSSDLFQFEGQRDGPPRLFDSKTGFEVKLPDASNIQDISSSEPGLPLILTYRDGTQRLWNDKTHSEIHFPGVQRILQIHFYGEWSVFYDQDHMFRLFNIRTGQEISLPGSKNIAKASFSTGTDRIAVIYADTTLRLFEIPTGAEIPWPESKDVFECQFSPSGQQIAIQYKGASYYGNAQLFDARTGAAITLKDEKNITGITFSPSGEFILAAYRNGDQRVLISQSGAEIALSSLLKGTGQFLDQDRMVTRDVMNQTVDILLNLKDFLPGTPLSKVAGLWKESLGAGLILLKILKENTAAEKSQDIARYWPDFFRSIESLNRLTTDYNRERVEKIITRPDYWKKILEQGADFKRHLNFYLKVMEAEPKMALLILEELFGAILKGGIISLELPDVEQQMLLDFIQKTNGFNPTLYLLYRKGGDAWLKEALAYGQKVLDGNAYPDSNAEVSFVKTWNERGLDGQELLLAVHQSVIPSSGTSFVQKDEIKALWKDVRALGNLSDHVPASLKGLGRFGGGTIERYEHKLRNGEVLDPDSKIRQLLESLRYPDSGKSQEEREKAKAEDRQKFVIALRPFLENPQDKTKRRNAFEAFLALARHEDLLREKIERVQWGEYASFELMDSLFRDKDNLSVLLREVLETEMKPEGNQPIQNSARVKGALRGIWNSGIGPAEKEKALEANVSRFTVLEIRQKILNDESLDPILRAVIEKMANQRISLKRSPAEVVENLFSVVLDAGTDADGKILSLFDVEKKRFDVIVSDKSVKLKFRIVPPHPFWGLLAGVCIAKDLKLIAKKEFYLLEMIDETTGQAVGFVHLFEHSIDGKRYLTVPGIEPSVEFLSEVKAAEVYPMIEEALAMVKTAEKFEAVWLPTDANILSNRKDIYDLAVKRNYAKVQFVNLPNHPPAVEWNTLPKPYPFSEVFDLSRSATIAETQATSRSEAREAYGWSPFPQEEDRTPAQIEWDGIVNAHRAAFSWVMTALGYTLEPVENWAAGKTVPEISAAVKKAAEILSENVEATQAKLNDKNIEPETKEIEPETRDMLESLLPAYEDNLKVVTQLAPVIEKFSEDFPNFETQRSEARVKLVSEMEPINEGATMIVQESDLNHLVEVPLLEAVRYLYRLNIRTYQSSANRDNYARGEKAYIIADFQTLSRRNQKIVEQRGWYKKGEKDFKIEWGIREELTVEALQQLSLKTVKILKPQPLEWGWMTRKQVQDEAKRMRYKKLSEKVLKDVARVRLQPAFYETAKYGPLPEIFYDNDPKVKEMDKRYYASRELREKAIAFRSESRTANEKVPEQKPAWSPPNWERIPMGSTIHYVEENWAKATNGADKRGYYAVYQPAVSVSAEGTEKNYGMDAIDLIFEFEHWKPQAEASIGVREAGSLAWEHPIIHNGRVEILGDLYKVQINEVKRSITLSRSETREGRGPKGPTLKDRFGKFIHSIDQDIVWARRGKFIGNNYFRRLGDLPRLAGVFALTVMIFSAAVPVVAWAALHMLIDFRLPLSYARLFGRLMVFTTVLFFTHEIAHYGTGFFFAWRSKIAGRSHSTVLQRIMVSLAGAMSDVAGAGVFLTAAALHFHRLDALLGLAIYVSHVMVSLIQPHGDVMNAIRIYLSQQKRTKEASQASKSFASEKKFRSEARGKTISTQDPVIVVGGSTNGDMALLEILSRLPKNRPPVIAVEHVSPSPNFMEFAVDPNHPISIYDFGFQEKPVNILLRNDLIVYAKAARIMKNEKGEPFVRVYPSYDSMYAEERKPLGPVNVLFASAAGIFGKNVSAVVTSGYGNDSLEGARSVKGSGGEIYVQKIDPEAPHRLGENGRVALEDVRFINQMPNSVMNLGIPFSEAPIEELAAVIMAGVKKNAARSEAREKAGFGVPTPSRLPGTGHPRSPSDADLLEHYKKLRAGKRFLGETYTYYDVSNLAFEKEYAEKAGDHHTPVLDWWLAAVEKKYQEALRSRPGLQKKDFKILELGSGDGYLAKRLAENGFDITGLDFDSEFVKTASDNNPFPDRLRFARGDATDLDRYRDFLEIPDNSFDLVITNEFVGDLPIFADQAREKSQRENRPVRPVVAELMRKLKPGGSYVQGDYYENVFGLTSLTEEGYIFYSVEDRKRAMMEAGIPIEAIREEEISLRQGMMHKEPLSAITAVKPMHETPEVSKDQKQWEQWAARLDDLRRRFQEQDRAVEQFAGSNILKEAQARLMLRFLKFQADHLERRIRALEDRQAARSEARQDSNSPALARAPTTDVGAEARENKTARRDFLKISALFLGGIWASHVFARQNLQPSPLPVRIAVAPKVTEVRNVSDLVNIRLKQDQDWQFFNVQGTTIYHIECATSRIENEMFLRLSLFAEDDQYAGQIVSDAVLAKMGLYPGYDFDLHDIARFYTQARKENMSLKPAEKKFLEDLMTLGFLTEQNGEYRAVRPMAIISASQDAVPKFGKEFRKDIIYHEWRHGIFFSDSEIEQKVMSMWNNELSERQRAILGQALWYLSRYDRKNPRILATELHANWFDKSSRLYYLLGAPISMPDGQKTSLKEMTALDDVLNHKIAPRLSAMELEFERNRNLSLAMPGILEKILKNRGTNLPPAGSNRSAATPPSAEGEPRPRSEIRSGREVREVSREGRILSKLFGLPASAEVTKNDLYRIAREDSTRILEAIAHVDINLENLEFGNRQPRVDLSNELEGFRKAGDATVKIRELKKIEKMLRAALPRTYPEWPSILQNFMNPAASEIMRLLFPQLLTQAPFVLRIPTSETPVAARSEVRQDSNSPALARAPTTDVGAAARNTESRQYVDRKIAVFYESAGIKPLKRGLPLTTDAGLYAPIPRETVHDVLDAYPIPLDRTIFLVDAGGGRCEFAIRLAHRFPNVQIVSIEHDEGLWGEGKRLLVAAENAGFVKQGRIQFLKGDFNSPDFGHFFQQADRVHYFTGSFGFDDSEAPLKAFAETLAKNLKPGSQIIEYGIMNELLPFLNETKVPFKMAKIAIPLGTSGRPYLLKTYTRTETTPDLKSVRPKTLRSEVRAGELKNKMTAAWDVVRSLVSSSRNIRRSSFSIPRDIRLSEPISQDNMPPDFRGWFFPEGSEFWTQENWGVLSREGTPHTGIDFAFYIGLDEKGAEVIKPVPSGIPVRAVADGTVKDVAQKLLVGGEISVEVSPRLRLNYVLAHIQPDPGIKKGDVVKKGQVLGKTQMLGKTIEDSETHLHCTWSRTVNSALFVIDPMPGFFPKVFEASIYNANRGKAMNGLRPAIIESPKTTPKPTARSEARETMRATGNAQGATEKSSPLNVARGTSNEKESRSEARSLDSFRHGFPYTSQKNYQLRSNYWIPDPSEDIQALTALMMQHFPYLNPAKLGMVIRHAMHNAIGHGNINQRAQVSLVATENDEMIILRISNRSAHPFPSKLLNHDFNLDLPPPQILSMERDLSGGVEGIGISEIFRLLRDIYGKKVAIRELPKVRWEQTPVEADQWNITFELRIPKKIDEGTVSETQQKRSEMRLSKDPLGLLEREKAVKIVAAQPFNEAKVQSELRDLGRKGLEKARKEFDDHAASFRSELRKMERPDVFLRSKDLLARLEAHFGFFGDTRTLAVKIRSLVMPAAFAAEKTANPAVANVVPGLMRQLADTLDRVKDGNLTVAFDHSAEGLTEEFLKIPGEKTSRVTEIALSGPVTGAIRTELRKRGITIRTARLDKNFIPRNDQSSVPFATAFRSADRVAAPVFDPVVGDTAGIQDLFVRDFMNRLMVVAVIQLADIKTHRKPGGAVMTRSEIRNELLRRLNLFEQKALIQSQGRGFVISSAAVQAFLEMQARQSIQQAA